MFLNVRTTLELPEILIKQARDLARERGITLDTLAADALRGLIEAQVSPKPYKMPDTTFGGDGLVDELPDLNWERIRHLI